LKPLRVSLSHSLNIIRVFNLVILGLIAYPGHRASTFV
jgi:hypothetical protein